MKSIFDFIVEPYGQRYNNEVKVGDKSLIINTQSESWGNKISGISNDDFVDFIVSE